MHSSASCLVELVFGKAVEKRRVPHTDFSIDAKTEIVPATDPVTVMQRCGRCVAVVNKRFVVTPAGAHRACPAGVAVVARTNMVCVEKLIARFVVHTTVLHVPHLSRVGIDEAVTKIDITSG